MGNYHAGFGSGGEGGDPLADHNAADVAVEAPLDAGFRLQLPW